MAYGKVDETFWDDPTLQELADRNPDTRWLFLYLLTCRHKNRLGCYVLDLRYAAADVGWELQRVVEAIAMLQDANRIAYDSAHRVVFIVRFLKHNTLENHKVVQGAIGELNRLPASPLVVDLLARVEKHARPHYSALITALRNRIGNDTPNDNTNGIGNDKAYHGTALSVALPVTIGTDTEAKASEAAPRDEKQPSEPGDAPPRQPSANGKRDLPDMAWGEFVGALKRAVEVHCWRQAQVPEVVVAGDASWTMDREISIAAALVREHELTGAEMLGAISVARETLGLPDKPITLRIFRGGKNGPGKFRDCLHEYRKREARRAQDDPGAPTSMASVLAGLGIPVVS